MITILNKNKNNIPPESVYIGRGSVFGNPFYWDESCHPQARYKVRGRDEACDEYEKHLDEEIRNGNPEICDGINGLIIRNLLKQEISLTCFCSPLRCHGESIKKKVESSKYCINWFSNMRKFDKPLIYQGIKFLAPENFYQATKLPKERTDLRQEIAQMTPHLSKKEIRSRGRYEWRADWDREESLRVMRYALEYKFAPDTTWGQKLKNYKGEIIEWNNWRDEFYGVNIFTGEGENWLGRILTEIKSKL